MGGCWLAQHPEEGEQFGERIGRTRAMELRLSVEGSRTGGQHPSSLVCKM